MVSQHALRQTPPPWTEFLTQATENITLSQTSFADGKKEPFGMKKMGTMFHQASQTKSTQSKFILFSHHNAISLQFEHFRIFFSLLLRIATFTLLALISEPLIKRSVTA